MTELLWIHLLIMSTTGVCNLKIIDARFYGISWVIVEHTIWTM